MLRSLSVALAAACIGGVAGQDKANVIFILSDDLGYGDYSIATELLPNSTRIPTPNVARMVGGALHVSG